MKAVPKTEMAIKFAGCLQIKIPDDPFSWDVEIFKDELERAERILNYQLLPNITVPELEFVSCEDLRCEFWDNLELEKYESCKHLFGGLWKGSLFQYDEKQTTFDNLCKDPFFINAESEGLISHNELEELAMRYHHVCSRTNIVINQIVGLYKSFEKEESQRRKKEITPKVTEVVSQSDFEGLQRYSVSFTKYGELLRIMKGVISSSVDKTILSLALRCAEPGRVWSGKRLDKMVYVLRKYSELTGDNEKEYKQKCAESFNMDYEKFRKRSSNDPDFNQKIDILFQFA